MKDPDTDYVQIQDRVTMVRSNAFQKYLVRINPTIRLLDWMRLCNWDTQKLRPRAQPRAIQYYPRYQHDPTSDHLKSIVESS